MRSSGGISLDLYGLLSADCGKVQDLRSLFVFSAPESASHSLDVGGINT